ncbi:MAG TPA: MFS transporter [Candidatus Dormibacteraeota bacterium]|nr:MFS transporter [Candidatus Dormibacteraeota bacterium]
METAAPPAVSVDAATESRRELSYRRLLAINFFKFGGDGVHWTPLNTVVLQVLAVAVAAGSSSQGALIVSKAGSAGAVFAVVVPIVVGYLSDRTATRFGRRRPWIAIGTLVNLFGLGLLAGAGSVPALIGAYLVIQISNNAAFAAYSAVIPDVVPIRQNGQASGLLNAMQQLGTVVGLFALTIILSPNRLGSTHAGAVAGLWVIGLATAGSLIVCLAAIPERPVERVRAAIRHPVSAPAVVAAAAALAAVIALEVVLLAPISIWWFAGAAAGVIAAVVAVGAGSRVAQVRATFAPLQDRDFFWVLTTRFFNTFGIWTIAPYIAYFFKDVVHTKDYGFESSLWLLAVIGGGVIPAVIGGHLSDRLGGRRKIFVYVSSAVQAGVSAVLLFSLISNVPVLYVLGLIFGFGFGAYQAVDWALACDVLPDRENSAAKDMALFHVSFTLPQVFGPALAGQLLFHLNELYGNNFGYRVVFASAAVWFFLSLVFVRNIRAVR